MAMAYLAQYPVSPGLHYRTSSTPLICSQSMSAAWSPRNSAHAASSGNARGSSSTTGRVRGRSSGPSGQYSRLLKFAPHSLAAPRCRLRRQRPDSTQLCEGAPGSPCSNPVSISDIVVRALKSLSSTNSNGSTPNPGSPGSPHSPLTDGDIQRRGVCAARVGAHCGRPCVDGEAYMVRADLRLAEEECGACGRTGRDAPAANRNERTTVLARAAVRR